MECWLSVSELRLVEGRFVPRCWRAVLKPCWGSTDLYICAKM